MAPVDDQEQGAELWFPNRGVAGERLAAALNAFAGEDTVVLGIPRGGVIVAAEVARLLRADFGALVSRKLETPGRPELAMGAVTASGGMIVNEETVARHEITPEQLAVAIAQGSADAASRQSRYCGDRPAPRLAGRTVIVVDDGLATGATMQAALQQVRGEQPTMLVAAIPVGDPEACAELHEFADAVVCLTAPADFSSVSYYYDDFRAPDDETVRRLLQEIHDPGQELDSDAASGRAPRRD